MAGIEIGACPNIARGPLFLPYWPPPSWEKRLAPARPRCLFQHDKSPTSTGSAEVPGASRQLNNRLGRRAWQKYGKGSATAPGCMRHNGENICVCAQTIGIPTAAKKADALARAIPSVGNVLVIPPSNYE